MAHGQVSVRAVDLSEVNIPESNLITPNTALKNSGREWCVILALSFYFNISFALRIHFQRTKS